MGKWITAPQQVRSLAKAVSAAFAASNLTAEEKSPNKIELTDLPWQAPPLVTELTIADAALQDYLDAPLPLQAANLHRFWVQTMNDMVTRPSRLMSRGALANCGWAMRGIKVGQRAHRFAVPIGYPGMLDESAGAVFSLEVAHAAQISLPLKDFVSDDSNYYVVLADTDELIGVRNGRPIAGDWSYDVSGQVPDLLTMSRGETSYTCRYDQIALMRSVLHVHRASFPKNFEAVDTALQALRYLSLGGYCPELVYEDYVAPEDVSVLRQCERAFRDAITAVGEPTSDRVKLQVIYEKLVPEVITGTAFRQNIWAGQQYPFTLAAGKMDSILEWLRAEYKTRVPSDMRKLKD